MRVNVVEKRISIRGAESTFKLELIQIQNALCLYRTSSSLYPEQKLHLFGIPWNGHKLRSFGGNTPVRDCSGHLGGTRNTPAVAGRAEGVGDALRCHGRAQTLEPAHGFHEAAGALPRRRRRLGHGAGSQREQEERGEEQGRGGGRFGGHCY